jgi:hypothetical protein
MAKRSALLGPLVCCAVIAACQATGSPLGPSSSATGSSSGGGGGAGGGSDLVRDAGDDGPPALDSGGFCGNQIHQAITRAPNLYFVFDASGSMGEAAGGGFTRYQLVEHSAVEMIQTLGPLINVGAAVFPRGASSTDSCHVGGEVFPVTPGDPISPATGPTTGGFIAATSLVPAGGTPTAATLTALTPGLTALKGRTVVLLATDGGPNCNGSASCAADQCIANLEGQCVPLGTNCCAVGGASGPEGCLDHDAAVNAVETLATAGVLVYVIGIPGSDLYAAVLDDMAVAGGAPQPGPTSYYRVDDLVGLEQVFQSIASKYISCDFDLADPPPDQDHTNVYFDKNVVPEDPVDGWVWKSPSEIELVGAACAKLKAGAVKQVQIVSGCPTQHPN